MKCLCRKYLGLVDIHHGILRYEAGISVGIFLKMALGGELAVESGELQV